MRIIFCVGQTLLARCLVHFGRSSFWDYPGIGLESATIVSNPPFSVVHASFLTAASRHRVVVGTRVCLVLSESAIKACKE